MERLVRNRLNFVSSDFDRCVLIDHLDGQNKSHTVSLLHQRSLDALHHTALDADLFADDQLSIWLDPLSAEVRTEKFNLSIGNRNRPLTIANNPESSRRLQDLQSLLFSDMHEEIGRKQRLNDLHTLPVLPDTRAFPCGEERLNLSDVEVL